MAYIEPRKNKNGEIIAYRIRVNKGYDKNGKKLKPYEFTFKPDPKKTERQNLKALNEATVEFERKCKQGYEVDNKQTFSEYAEYVIALKERTGVKRRTVEGSSVLIWIFPLKVLVLSVKELFKNIMMNLNIIPCGYFISKVYSKVVIRFNGIIHCIPFF